jgi:hypothetical protein
MSWWEHTHYKFQLKGEFNQNLFYAGRPQGEIGPQMEEAKEPKLTQDEFVKKFENLSRGMQLYD